MPDASSPKAGLGKPVGGDDQQHDSLIVSVSPTGGMTGDSWSDMGEDINEVRNSEDLNNTFELKTIPHPISQVDRSTRPYDADEIENDAGADEEKLSIPERSRSKESFMLYTPDEEKNVVKKLDRRLVLFLALLYMLSFLDRSNIGNAKIAGLSDDLELSSSQYEWLLSAFYITYIIFEWMTLLYRIIPAHIYVSICVAAWGLIASLQCVANSFSVMFILRALLGISEAAFGPGVPFYLSFFYKREELALRTGLFISAAPLATSFASSLAWVITKVGQNSPFAAWRLLFLIEGFPSMIVALFAWYTIPDGPATARYLTKRQKKVAVLRLRKNRRKSLSETSGLKWREIGHTLIDPKCYITAMMFFSCNVAFSSLPPFLPTIVKEMGYSALASQALSAPPYIVSFFVVLLTAYLSDRYRNRGFFVCFVALMGSFGYLVIAVAGWKQTSFRWRYAGVFPAAAGFFSAITLIIAWTINNQDSDSKKGTGLAMLNILGQFGPLVGTRLYPDSDKPYYIKGMSVCAGFMFIVFLFSLSLRYILIRENKRAGVAYEPVGENDEETDLADEGSMQSSHEHHINML